HRPGQGAGAVPGFAGPGQAGAHHRFQQGRAGHPQAPVPDHGQAGHVRGQRGRRRLREQPLPGPPKRVRRRPERPGGRHLRQDRSRTVGNERRRPRHVPGRNGPGRTGPEPPDPRRFQPAGPADLLHRRREGSARLDHP
ncbi:putative GTP-dependent Nucleic acid-binding protein engD, partial [Daphnia magna]